MKQVKILNRNHKAWREILYSKWPTVKATTLDVSFYKLIILQQFFSTTKPNKHLTNLEWTKERELRLIEQFTCAYLYNKFIVGEELKYSSYNTSTSLLTRFLNDIDFSFNESEVSLVVENLRTKELFNDSIGKEPVDHFAVRKVTVKRTGEVYINDDVLCVQSLAKKGRAKKVKIKEDLAPTPSVTKSGKMVNAQPVWKAGHPKVSGLYICASFPTKEKELTRDVLCRFAVSDEKTEVNHREEGTRAQENLYYFDLEASKDGKSLCWQHAMTGFYDGGITHYLDFEVTYE